MPRGPDLDYATGITLIHVRGNQLCGRQTHMARALVRGQDVTLWLGQQERVDSSVRPWRSHEKRFHLYDI